MDSNAHLEVPGDDCTSNMLCPKLDHHTYSTRQPHPFSFMNSTLTSFFHTPHSVCQLLSLVSSTQLDKTAFTISTALSVFSSLSFTWLPINLQSSPCFLLVLCLGDLVSTTSNRSNHIVLNIFPLLKTLPWSPSSISTKSSFLQHLVPHSLLHLRPSPSHSPAPAMATLKRPDMLLWDLCQTSLECSSSKNCLFHPLIVPPLLSCSNATMMESNLSALHQEAMNCLFGWCVLPY